MHIKFPYHKILVPATNGQRAKKSRLIPYINVRIFNEDKYLDVLALIDSGAEYCLFDGEIGEIIGLENIENDDKIDVLGIGQITKPFYLHDIEIEIGGHKFPCQGGFSYNYKGPPLLGQYGFFSLFKVIFNFQKEEIELVRK